MAEIFRLAALLGSDDVQLLGRMSRGWFAAWTENGSSATVSGCSHGPCRDGAGRGIDAGGERNVLMKKEPLSRVAIVDADAGLRADVTEALQRLGLSVQAFAGADDFRRQSPSIDCLVIDLQLPGSGGETLHKELCEAGETAAIIVTTPPIAIAKVVAAIQRGALTVLEKPYDLDALCGHVLAGLKQTATVRRQAAEKRRLADEFRSLTQREREVFRLLLTGMHVKQIGLTLGIGVKTVHTFRSHIMQKMAADSNAELIRRVALAFGRAGIEEIGSLADDQSLAELMLTP